MTYLAEIAKEPVADLHREAAIERPAGSARAAGPERDTPRPHTRRRGSLGRALSTLGMPLEEIQAVLRANDPAVVARYMELHRERLAEQLAHRVRELEALERILTRRSRVAGPR
jgi:hypothetical protein